MNIIDKFVDYFSPTKGLERIRARAATSILTGEKTRSYDAARHVRSRYGFTMMNGSASSDIVPQVDTIRARSRDLAKNNPYVKAALEILVRHEIGWGIRPRSTLVSQKVKGNRQTVLKNIDEARNTEWKIWAEGTKCDFYGRHNFYGLQTIIRRTMAESGECLVRLRMITRSEAAKLGLRIPLQLQVLEPDYLDTSMDTTIIGKTFRGATSSVGGYISGGIEHDAEGRRVAYWLHRQHPGDSNYVSVSGNLSFRVPVNECLHVFKQTRPGQPRGVPELHAAINVLQDLDDFTFAWLMRAKVEASISVFVRDGIDGTPPQLKAPTEAGSEPEEEDNDVSIAPGSIIRLKSGQDISTLNPSSSGGQIEFIRHCLRSAAASIAIGYDQLASDPSQANYSSIRSARIEFKRQIETDQWNTFIPQICNPVWEAFCNVGSIMGYWTTDGIPSTAEWVPPPFELMDPTKEIPAKQLAIRNGLLTPQQAIQEQGYDPEEQLSQFAEWNKKMDAAGVMLDSDPRSVDRAGKAQKAEPTAADNSQPENM